MNRQYNNELTPELLAGMNDETRALIFSQQEYCRQHPVNADPVRIYIWEKIPSTGQ